MELMQKLKVPSEAVSAQALTAARDLAPWMGKKHKAGSTVTLRPENGTAGKSVTVPVEAFEMFVDILQQMAAGKTVVVFPYEPELTTQQAAELLNVSRPYLVRLIEDKKLPCRKVGTHRRIKMTDLLAYRDAEDARRQKVLDEMTAEAQKLGLDY